MVLHLIDIVVMGSNNYEAVQLKAELTKSLSMQNENFIMRNIYQEIANKLQENTN